MATIKVANFTFIHEGVFTLPGIRHSSPADGAKPHIRGTHTLHFDLPEDARPRGMLSFSFGVSKGHDNGVDLVFEVTVNGGSKGSWGFFREEYTGLQVPVHGLRAGENYLVFETTKAGKVTPPDPDESLGGKGTVTFGGVCPTYHRDVKV